jgi:hypothetical protein
VGNAINRLRVEAAFQSHERTMKHLAITVVWMTGWVAICLAMAGCVTTVTTVTAPDGTVTETRVTAPDAEASRIAADVAIAFAGRAIILDEK